MAFGTFNCNFLTFHFRCFVLKFESSFTQVLSSLLLVLDSQLVSRFGALARLLLNSGRGRNISASASSSTCRRGRGRRGGGGGAGPSNHSNQPRTYDHPRACARRAARPGAQPPWWTLNQGEQAAPSRGRHLNNPAAGWDGGREGRGREEAAQVNLSAVVVVVVVLSGTAAGVLR